MLCHLNAPLMVLAYRDNHQAAVTVPAGRTIDVLRQDQDERFCVIRVDGEEFLAFESDLLGRGPLNVRRQAQTQNVSPRTRRASAR